MAGRGLSAASDGAGDGGRIESSADSSGRASVELERPARESMRPMNVFDREGTFLMAFLGEDQTELAVVLVDRRHESSSSSCRAWSANSGGVTRSNVGEGGVWTAAESSDDFSEDQLPRESRTFLDFPADAEMCVVSFDGSIECNQCGLLGGGVGGISAPMLAPVEPMTSRTVSWFSLSSSSAVRPSSCSNSSSPPCKRCSSCTACATRRERSGVAGVDGSMRTGIRLRTGTVNTCTLSTGTAEADFARWIGESLGDDSLGDDSVVRVEVLRCTTAWNDFGPVLSSMEGSMYTCSGRGGGTIMGFGERGRRSEELRRGPFTGDADESTADSGEQCAGVSRVSIDSRSLLFRPVVTDKSDGRFCSLFNESDNDEGKSSIPSPELGTEAFGKAEVAIDGGTISNSLSSTLAEAGAGGSSEYAEGLVEEVVSASRRLAISASGL